MELQEILRALPTLDDAQLRSLNSAIIAQLKAERRVSKAIAAVTIVVGQQYVTQKLRPHQNGLIVEVLEKKTTKALVQIKNSAQFPRPVLIPMDCLGPLPEAYGVA